MEIEAEVLQNTKKCTSNFECLINEDYVCRNTIVDRNYSNKILFIDCPKSSCNYRTNFADKTICSCPVRIEIYVKYKQ